MKLDDLCEDLYPAMPTPPDDIDRDEGYFRSDAYEIYWQTWTGENEPTKGGVALLHGFAEHSNRYHHVASALCRAGYGVIGIDVRGHGRSSGKRAYIKDFAAYPKDLDQLLAMCTEKFGGPTFCLAHSYGGLVSLSHAVDGRHQPSAYAVTSPFCGIYGSVPAIKEAAGNVMSKIYPSFAQATDLDASKISHIADVVKQYERDPLVFGIATARWFTETKAAQTALLERAKDISTPVLFLVAGSDEIVDARATENVYHAMGNVDRELELFPDLYHEILNEDPWVSILEKAVVWFEKHSP